MSTARRALRSMARVPWRATQLLPIVAQRRIKLLLGDPPLGPDGVWSALDPHSTYAQGATVELIGLLTAAAREAIDIHPALLEARVASTASASADWIDAFPGEHYRLLAALTRVLDPRVVVEIGTYTGASALAFLDQGNAHVVTYDLVPWNEIKGTLLTQDDFSGGRLEQRLIDLSPETTWRQELALFRQADLVLLDGPKDGVFEPLMLRRLAALATEASFLLVVDDIRFLEMLECWAAFPAPKLDATSFGHWSGTGLAFVGPPHPRRS